MKSELAKVQAAKKEHAKMLRNQSHHEKQLQVYQRDIAEMKKLKVAYLVFFQVFFRTIHFHRVDKVDKVFYYE